jgi:hypothetical protein
MPKKQTLLGEHFRKIQPKLRVISNGSTQVNAVRAQQCGGISVDDDVSSETRMTVTDETSPIKASKLPKSAKKGKMKQLSKKVRANVFIQLLRPNSDDKNLPGITSRRGNILTATVTGSELKKLAENKNVAFVEIGANVSAPTPDVSKKKVDEPSLKRWQFNAKKEQKNGKSLPIDHKYG